MKTQLSILALAIAASTTAFADQTIATDSDSIKIVVNSDNGNIGGFVIQNGDGSAGSVNTLVSNKHDTTIQTSNGNKLILDNDGAHLSNITLDGVKAGEVSATSNEAINGAQLHQVKLDAAAEKAAREAAIAKEKAEREEADDVLLDLLAGEEKSRIDADKVLQGNIDKEAAIREEADKKLTADLAQEVKDRIEGDRQTLAAANAYTDQRINKIEKNYKAAVAAGIAIASLPQPTTAGKNMFSIGAGTWESEQGYALGVSGVTADNKWVYKVAATGDSRGNFGGGASVGFQW